MKTTTNYTNTAASALWMLTSSLVLGQYPTPPAPGADGEARAAAARGHAAFNQRNLHQIGGNGRSCADCHMAAESFQLSPAAAEARFHALLARRVDDAGADDPLFRPVDADDFRENGESRDQPGGACDQGYRAATVDGRIFTNRHAAA